MSAAGPHVASARGAMGIRHVAVPALHPLEQPAPRPTGVRRARAAAPTPRDPTSSTPTTRSPASSAGSPPASPGRRWSSTPSTACGPSRATAGGADGRCTQPSASPRRSATSNSSRTPRTSTTLVDVLHVPARKVRLLGNGVDLARFDPDAVGAGVPCTHLRAEWGIADGEVVCAVVGRLVREKGIVELLEAALTLRAGEACRLASWWSARPTPTSPTPSTRPSIGRQRRRRRRASPAPRDDMPECYAAVDLFVTASWREGFPRSAMEAAAMGSATVATDIRGNRQVIVDGETGLLVPVRDAAAPRVRDRRSRRRRSEAAMRWALPRGSDRRRVRSAAHDRPHARGLHHARRRPASAPGLTRSGAVGGEFVHRDACVLIDPVAREHGRDRPARMRRSFARLQRSSTYSTSSARRSSQPRVLRPLTCASPVMPGRTSKRRYSSPTEAVPVVDGQRAVARRA